MDPSEKHAPAPVGSTPPDLTRGPAPGSRSIGIVGTGRAGRSFAEALADRGWNVELLAHAETSVGSLEGLVSRVAIVLLCVPDNAIAEVARTIAPRALADDVVVAHCSGASPLSVLGSVGRRGSVHPLVSLDGTNSGALRGAWFAVAGDGAVRSIVDALNGRLVEVSDGDRALYHAAAAIASNHLVALLAQVESVATALDVPLDAFMDLARGSLDNASRHGPRRALTGPVSRGDWATVHAHLAALVEGGLATETEAYRALARRAAVLAGIDPDRVDH